MDQDVRTYNEAVSIILENRYDSWTIVGDTGTGKTTQVTTSFGSRNKNVFICLNNKIGVNAAYKYVKKNSPKLTIGFSSGKNSNYENSFITSCTNLLTDVSNQLPGRNTQIVFFTNSQFKILIRNIYKFLIKITAGKPSRQIGGFCDILIVDDCHLKTKDQEMIIRYWNKIKETFQNFQYPKLIKMSATISTQDTCMLKYHEDGNKKTKIYYYDSIIARSGKTLSEHLRGKLDIIEILKFFLSEIKHSYEDISRMQGIVHNFVGTVLIFFPSLAEIKKTKNILIENVEKIQKITGRFEILIAHSTIDAESLGQILNPRRENWRIVLSTDICETSITIPGVTIVIDTMEKKYLEEGNKGTTILRKREISKDSAEQRAGRTGRDVIGIVIRMIKQSKYERLRQSEDSEIAKLPIYKEVIEIMSTNIGPREFFSDLKITGKISKIMTELTELGCIIKRGQFNELTNAGIFCENISLSVENCVLIYKTVELSNGHNIFQDIISIVAIEAYQSSFSHNYPNIRDYPLQTFIEPFKKLIDSFGSLMPNRQNKDEFFRFCETNHLYYDGFKEFLYKIEEIVVYLITNKKVNIEFENISYPYCYDKMLQLVDNVYPLLKKEDGVFKDKHGIEYVLNSKFNSQYLDHEMVYALSFRSVNGNSLLVDVALPLYYNENQEEKHQNENQEEKHQNDNKKEHNEDQEEQNENQEQKNDSKKEHEEKNDDNT